MNAINAHAYIPSIPLGHGTLEDFLSCQQAALEEGTPDVHRRNRDKKRTGSLLVNVGFPKQAQTTTRYSKLTFWLISTPHLLVENIPATSAHGGHGGSTTT